MYYNHYSRWNTWNAYRCGALNYSLLCDGSTNFLLHKGISESVILAAAKQFVSLGLKDAGYQYVNIDVCRFRYFWEIE
jgi:alpha-galactosidase